LVASQIRTSALNSRYFSAKLAASSRYPWLTITNYQKLTQFRKKNLTGFRATEPFWREINLIIITQHQKKKKKPETTFKLQQLVSLTFTQIFFFDGKLSSVLNFWDLNWKIYQMANAIKVT
jgi:hypothetical protein